MKKLDLTKEYKKYYTASVKPEFAEFGTLNYISISGNGDPSDELFSKNIEALYSVAYTIKFAFKAMDKDFVASKLEGLWWFDEDRYKHIPMMDAPIKIPRSEWEYRLLIRMPDFVNQSSVAKAKAAVVEKKAIQKANEIIYFEMNEGKVIQVLHIGPFDKEPESLQKLFDFSAKNNLKQNGLHHEIYLSDFRKTEPAKLKTILREPVK